jgi:hypothetical protein
LAGEGGAPDGNGVVGNGRPGDGIGVFGGGSGFREGVHGAGGPDNGTGVFGQASGNGPGLLAIGGLPEPLATSPCDSRERRVRMPIGLIGIRVGGAHNALSGGSCHLFGQLGLWRRRPEWEHAVPGGSRLRGGVR